MVVLVEGCWKWRQEVNRMVKEETYGCTKIGGRGWSQVEMNDLLWVISGAAGGVS